MIQKINKLLSKSNLVDIISESGNSNDWFVKAKYLDLHFSIYKSELNCLKLELDIVVNVTHGDDDLIFDLYNISIDYGMYFKEPTMERDGYHIRCGFVIPLKLLTQKNLFEYFDLIYECYINIMDFISEYTKSCSIADLDVSMFMGDDINIQDFDLDNLLHIRESKFEGNWKKFRNFVNMDSSEKAMGLVKCIDKCIEFEKKNKRDLVDVYDKIRDELLYLSEQMSSRDIVFN